MCRKVAMQKHPSAQNTKHLFPFHIIFQLTRRNADARTIPSYEKKRAPSIQTVRRAIRNCQAPVRLRTRLLLTDLNWKNTSTGVRQKHFKTRKTPLFVVSVGTQPNTQHFPYYSGGEKKGDAQNWFYLPDLAILDGNINVMSTKLDWPTGWKTHDAPKVSFWLIFCQSHDWTTCHTGRPSHPTILFYDYLSSISKSFSPTSGGSPEAEMWEFLFVKAAAWI